MSFLQFGPGSRHRCPFTPESWSEDLKFRSLGIRFSVNVPKRTHKTYPWEMFLGLFLLYLFGITFSSEITYGNLSTHKETKKLCRVK